MFSTLDDLLCFALEKNADKNTIRQQIVWCFGDDTKNQINAAIAENTETLFNASSDSHRYDQARRAIQYLLDLNL